MVSKVKHIMDFMEEIAPKTLAESWDNVGLMIGDKNQDVKKILVALDGTSQVIDEALEIGADMIITHHPFILFQKMKSINKDNVFGEKIYSLIQNNISIFSAHTNLDSVDEGINDVLANLFNLENTEKLDEESGLGRIGDLKSPIKLEDFAHKIEETLKTNNLLRLVGNKEKDIKRVAVCGGSGASFISLAKSKGADLYITGDVKFHEAQDAQDLNLALADVTHYSGEVIIVPVLVEKLEKFIKENNLNIQVVSSKVNGQTFWNI